MRRKSQLRGRFNAFRTPIRALGAETPKIRILTPPLKRNDERARSRRE
jgi:hypothetical protein